MATTHDANTRNAIAKLVTELLEIGGSFPTVDLLLYNSGGSLLVRLPMGSAAFQPPIGGIASANTINQALPVLAGTPVSYRIRGKDGIFRMNGSVGGLASGADLEGVGGIVLLKPVQVSNFVYQAPP